ncbi:MAG: hypothetical protein AAF653_17620, partial [Chloroflexota bacterium]
MKSLRYWFTGICLMFLTSTVLAQPTQITLTQSVVMYPERYAVSMPDGWNVTYRKAFGKTELTNGEMIIGLYTEEGVLSRLMQIDETLTTSEL